VLLCLGFCTAKGDLVRSILYPKEIFFSFYQDTMKFILFLACVAAIGMCYTAIMLAQKNVNFSHESNCVLIIAIVSTLAKASCLTLCVLPII